MALWPPDPRDLLVKAARTISRGVNDAWPGANALGRELRRVPGGWPTAGRARVPRQYIGVPPARPRRRGASVYRKGAGRPD
jgi:hypothetical protein